MIHVRTFMVVDVDGQWHEGFSQLEFMPNIPESDFIHDFMLSVGNEITFDRFVHPLRWTSMYGRPYAAAKALIQAASNHASFYRDQIKRMKAADIEDASVKDEKHDFTGSDTEAAVPDMISIEVPNLVAEVVLGSKVEPMQVLKPGLENFQYAKAQVRALAAVLEPLRLVTRITEFAFYQLGDKREQQLPSWMSAQLWGREREGRTDWNSIDLPHCATGAKLRYRTTTTTTKVRS